MPTYHCIPGTIFQLYRMALCTVGYGYCNNPNLLELYLSPTYFNKSRFKDICPTSFYF